MQNLDGTWRIKRNDESRQRIKQEDINKIYKITKIEMGSPCNENAEHENY